MSVIHQNPYRDEHYDWNYYKRKRVFLFKRGFVSTPAWMPVGVAGYDWQIIDGWDAVMRPEAKLIHRIRFQILPCFIPKIVKRWQIRRKLDL